MNKAGYFIITFLVSGNHQNWNRCCGTNFPISFNWFFCFNLRL